jgi:hypothetical protein
VLANFTTIMATIIKIRKVSVFDEIGKVIGP